jgi:hypothetical protein
MMFNLNHVDPNNVKVIVQRLWPTMLFLVVMTVVTNWLAQSWVSNFENEIHSIISFYFWFFSCLVVTIYGVIAFYKDAKIQTASTTEA